MFASWNQIGEWLRRLGGLLRPERARVFRSGWMNRRLGRHKTPASCLQSAVCIQPRQSALEASARKTDTRCLIGIKPSMICEPIRRALV
jgi:hypothetical protein